MAPDSTQELEKRLIRDVSRKESYGSIARKKTQMERDMAYARGASQINRSFICHDSKDLLKEAPVYIMHELYKF